MVNIDLSQMEINVAKTALQKEREIVRAGTNIDASPAERAAWLVEIQNTLEKLEAASDQN